MRANREGEATYTCSDPTCGEEWKVEGRWNADGDFEPTDEDATNCPECDSVGEYQEES